MANRDPDRTSQSDRGPMPDDMTRGRSDERDDMIRDDDFEDAEDTDEEEEEDDEGTF
jgi:hypothetical protein